MLIVDDYVMVVNHAWSVRSSNVTEVVAVGIVSVDDDGDDETTNNEPVLVAFKKCCASF